MGDALPVHFARVFWRHLFMVTGFNEDWIAMSAPLRFGYYYAKAYCNPTQHHRFFDHDPNYVRKELSSSRTSSRHAALIRWKERRLELAPRYYRMANYIESFRLMQEIFGWPEELGTGDFSVAGKKAAEASISKKYLEEVYRPAAIARFGKAEL